MFVALFKKVLESEKSTQDRSSKVFLLPFLLGQKACSMLGRTKLKTNRKGKVCDIVGVNP